MSTDAVAAMRAAKEYFDDIESDRADELSMMLDAAIKAAQPEPTSDEPVATLHDDGHWTWKRGKEVHASNFAGWKMDVYARPLLSAQPEPMSDERIEEAVQRGMRLAWQLGQTYWQQADSESWKQNKMAAGMVRKFDALLAETIAALAAAPKEPK